MLLEGWFGLLGHVAGQKGDVTSQRPAKPIKYHEGDVPFPSFHRTVVGSIDAGDQRKRFLRHADVLSLRPNPAAQLAENGRLVHPRG